jgi:hypothetical protein
MFLENLGLFDDAIVCIINSVLKPGIILRTSLDLLLPISMPSELEKLMSASIGLLFLFYTA